MLMHLANAGAPGAVDQGLFANLHAYVQINPALAPIAERLQLKRLVPMAVDQAIVEIITPVVERSATIACMTAQELIVKVSQANLHDKPTCTARASSCTVEGGLCQLVFRLSLEWWQFNGHAVCQCVPGMPPC